MNTTARSMPKFGPTLKEKSPIPTPAGSDLFQSIRTPLCIGAFLGLIPIENLAQATTGKQKFTLFHWRTYLTTAITILIGINVIFIGHGFLTLLTDSKRESTRELIGYGSGVWFYIAGMCVYLFFLIRSRALCAYFYKWTEVGRRIQDTTVPDKGVVLHMRLITWIVLGSCFGENVMFHVYIMAEDLKQELMQGIISPSELLRDYYRTNGYMLTFFTFNPFIALLLFVVNKCTLYAWNFGDVILMLISRALYGRFESLNLYLESRMVEDSGIRMIGKGLVCWENIRSNFLAIVQLLQDANEIFSPLLWLSYVTDIFFVCNQLYIELSATSNVSPSGTKMTSKPWVNSVYVLWSFFHLVIRTLAVNMLAAKVNQCAHRIKYLTQHCYPEEYDNHVKRLEQYLHGRVIGLSGNGCFVITSSFILMITSAIFTLEVVLLQNS